MYSQPIYLEQGMEGVEMLLNGQIWYCEKGIPAKSQAVIPHHSNPIISYQQLYIRTSQIHRGLLVGWTGRREQSTMRTAGKGQELGSLGIKWFSQHLPTASTFTALQWGSWVPGTDRPCLPLSDFRPQHLYCSDDTSTVNTWKATSIALGSKGWSWTHCQFYNEQGDTKCPW